MTPERSRMGLACVVREPFRDEVDGRGRGVQDVVRGSGA
jgi:hypothetical protein